MRLSPPASVDEAYEFLKQQAALTWGDERVGEMERDLRLVAAAMAQISAVDLPLDLEPLFP
jgi:hypothetical protein